MITHSAKKTEQQKEPWGWGLEMTGKCVCGQNLWGGQNLKKGCRQYRRGGVEGGHK